MTETDKIGHGYDPYYRALAAALPPGPTVVEIGTADGAGLRYFRSVFDPSLLAGVDRYPTPGAKAAAGRFVVAEQNSPLLPVLLGGEQWDLVVDDASHDNRLTTETLRIMWPMVAPGGAYVIEDWSHANMTCGFLAQQLPFAFAEDEANIARGVVLPGLWSVTYRPGLIVLRKRHDADHV